MPRPFITRGNWPLAQPDVFGLAAPIVLGTFDSVGTTGTGAVPGIRVYVADPPGAVRYLFSLFTLDEISRVYVDGVDTAGVGWTDLTPLIVGGCDYSAIEFATDPGADVAITADVVGPLTPGALPCAQLAFLLDNVVYGTYRGTALAAAPLDRSAFADAELYLAALRAEASFYLGTDPVVGFDLIRDWSLSTGVRAHWTEQGLLALLPDDHRLGLTYVEGHRVGPEESEVNQRLSLQYDGANLLERVVSRFLYQPAEGSYFFTLTVQETSLGEVGQEQFDRPFSRGYAT